MSLPPEVREILRRGVLCHVAAPGLRIPHLTPVVFALAGNRLWATTARRSRKNRLWRERPEAAGLVRLDERAVTFRGDVHRYDLLDPSSWPRSVLRSPALTRAATRYTTKNLRFFAGYARDARRVPMGWMPPGRVFFSLGLESWAILDDATGEVGGAHGRMGERVESRTAYRALGRAPLADEAAPEDVRAAVGASGEGALAVEGSAGSTVLPVRWRRVEEEGAYLASLPRAFLALGGVTEEFPATLTVDHASRWRASEMAGLQLRGVGQAFVPARLSSGAAPLLRRAGVHPFHEETAVVRLRPERVVWWRGWASGSLGRR